jgi:hypothetical protein
MNKGSHMHMIGFQFECCCILGNPSLPAVLIYDSVPQHSKVWDSQFPLAPMGVLAPRLRTLDGPLFPPSTRAKKFRHTCLGGGEKIVRKFF